MLAHKDQLPHAAPLHLLPGRREKRAENPPAPEIRMHHTRQLFLPSTPRIRLKIAHQLSILIIEEIVDLTPGTLPQHLQTNTHAQSITRIAYVDELLDLGDFAI